MELANIRAFAIIIIFLGLIGMFCTAYKIGQITENQIDNDSNKNLTLENSLENIKNNTKRLNELNFYNHISLIVVLLGLVIFINCNYNKIEEIQSDIDTILEDDYDLQLKYLRDKVIKGEISEDLYHEIKSDIENDQEKSNNSYGQQLKNKINKNVSTKKIVSNQICPKCGEFLFATDVDKSLYCKFCNKNILLLESNLLNNDNKNLEEKE